MTPKERLLSAIHFKEPDKPALSYYYTEVGYAEHGEKLLELYKKYPGDAEEVPNFTLSELPKPDLSDIMPDGSYHKIETDEWGITWEYRIYGRIGHAIKFPLDDLNKLDTYKFPAMPLSDPVAMQELRDRVKLSANVYPVKYSVPGLFERLIALCPFENVLMDIVSEEPLIEQLADTLTSLFREEVERALSAGVDIIGIGDDYGDERSLLMSPELWREFFLPRLKTIIAPIKKAGKTCCFHSCGQVFDILPDLKEAGADSIWPQLPLYDRTALKKRLHDIGLALCIHIDRGDLMQHGSPENVKAELDKVYHDFRPDKGGSWFYFEVDQGFPFDNVLALAEAIDKYRK